MLHTEINDTDVESARKNLGLIEKNSNVRGDRKKINKDELYGYARDLLSNKLRARPFLKRCDLNLLLWLQETLKEIIPDKELEEKTQKEKLARKSTILEQIRELISENDIVASDIYGHLDGVDNLDRMTVKKPRKTYQKKPKEQRKRTMRYKCHIFDRDYFWSGQGRMPKPFRCYLAEGHSVESIVLSKEEQFVLEDKEKHSMVIPDEYESLCHSLLIKYKKMKIPIYINHFQELSKD